MILLFKNIFHKKIMYFQPNRKAKVVNNQDMAQSERKSHAKTRDGKK